eukprot:361250-Chlamydomonas_euryale.AAC.7
MRFQPAPLAAPRFTPLPLTPLRLRMSKGRGRGHCEGSAKRSPRGAPARVSHKSAASGAASALPYWHVRARTNPHGSASGAIEAGLVVAGQSLGVGNSLWMLAGGQLGGGSPLLLHWPRDGLTSTVGRQGVERPHTRPGPQYQAREQGCSDACLLEKCQHRCTWSGAAVEAKQRPGRSSGNIAKLAHLQGRVWEAVVKLQTARERRPAAIVSSMLRSCTLPTACRCIAGWRRPVCLGLSTGDCCRHAKCAHSLLIARSRTKWIRFSWERMCREGRNEHGSAGGGLFTFHRQLVPPPA